MEISHSTGVCEGPTVLKVGFIILDGDGFPSLVLLRAMPQLDYVTLF
jgi:hypothetical protein